MTLPELVAYAGWPTAIAKDEDSSGGRDSKRTKAHSGTSLTDAAGWATPVATELGNTLENYLAMKRNMRSGPRSAVTHPSLQAQLVVTGGALSGFPASTEKRAQLNPAFSLWLMGYPTGWARSAARVTPSSRRSRRK